TDAPRTTVLQAEHEERRVAGTPRCAAGGADGARPGKARCARQRVGLGATAQALSRLRPLARRALMIARPWAVRMRARKPWARLRLRKLGWYVRFMLFRRGCVRRRTGAQR